nr:immunoglobulin heavy chain junction region [Mus musculus]NSM04577.1 immunoglobulin heavy chain junction region [Mus musculus]NSM06672.1 immunoglobulin heavy chain junction region [Mus musculus]
CTRGGFAYW